MKCQLRYQEGHTANACARFVRGNRQNPGDGTFIRGRIGKCQYGLQFRKEPSIFVYSTDQKVAALVDSGSSINIMSKLYLILFLSNTHNHLSD